MKRNNSMKKGFSLFLAVIILIQLFTANQALVKAEGLSVNFTINTKMEVGDISPYIYGTNQDLSGSERITARRLGGNRLSAYNWENNASNAGSDYNHSSDSYMTWVQGVPANLENNPGETVTFFHDKTLEKKAAYSLITLQAAGYASKDKKGTVSAAEKAPSNRWVEVKPSKGADFSLMPDLSDNTVYMDEFVNFLVSKYGNASSIKGIKGYSIDNEPALWTGTHPRMHPAAATAKEVIEKGVALSKAVKAVDPFAEMFGPAAYGFNEFYNNQNASDWEKIKAAKGYNWYLDYYLDYFKENSDTSGKRLLDVLDLHWYPEANGGGERVTTSNTGNINCNKERIQAPRSLWDANYKENSWIGQWFGSYLPLIPRVQKSMNQYYPGTKLGFTEYNYGGGNHISGGIAQADTLGIFSKYSVYFASLWKLSDDSKYISSAFKIFRNYDGKYSAYGNGSLNATASDYSNASIYASVNKINNRIDDSKIHLIAINKNYDNDMNASFSIDSDSSYKIDEAWAFDSNSPDITKRDCSTNSFKNTFTYTIPKLTVIHFVLSKINSGTSDSSVVPADLKGSSESREKGYDAETLLRYKKFSNSYKELLYKMIRWYR